MRSLAKSIGCSKTFPGPNALKTFAEIDHWLGALAIELGWRTKPVFFLALKGVLLILLRRAARRGSGGQPTNSQNAHPQV
jgi:membrane protein implicated in regulation of membrane protease activity